MYASAVLAGRPWLTLQLSMPFYAARACCVLPSQNYAARTGSDVTRLIVALPAHKPQVNTTLTHPKQQWRTSRVSTSGKESEKGGEGGRAWDGRKQNTTPKAKRSDDVVRGEKEKNIPSCARHCTTTLGFICFGVGAAPKGKRKPASLPCLLTQSPLLLLDFPSDRAKLMEQAHVNNTTTNVLHASECVHCIY